MSDRSIELLERATSHPGHLAGTDAERRTAKALADEITSAGLKPVVEPVWVHPRWPLTHALHCLVGIAGSLLASVVPIAGFALVLLAAASIYFDFNGRWYLLRQLTFRRASQNVVAVPDVGEGEDVILIAASYDAPRTGAAFNPGQAHLLELGRRLMPFLSPAGLVFWSLALLVPVVGLRMAGIEESWVSFLQLPQTIALVVASFLYVEMALSGPSPGGNINGASAAAATLAIEKARAAGVDSHIGLILCGGGDCGEQGMRSFLRNYRGWLGSVRPYVIGVEGGGVGSPRFARATAGPLSVPADPGLEELANALAETQDPDDLRGLKLVPGGPATVAGTYRVPAIQLCAREGDEYLAQPHRSPADTAEACDLGAIEALAERTADLVRLLDRQLSRARG